MAVRVRSRAVGKSVSPSLTLREERLADLIARFDVVEASAGQQRWARATFGALLLLMLCCVAAWAVLTYQREVYHVRVYVGPRASFLFLMAALLPLAYLAAAQAAVFRRPSAARLLERDPRPPVVYLRPFATDGRAAVPTESRGLETGGQLLTRLLTPIGPVVALRPRTGGHPLTGVAQDLVHDWQATVLALFSCCRLTVIRLGDSPNVLWELQRARELLMPHQVVLLVPADPLAYDRARRLTREVFPYGLPAHPWVSGRQEKRYPYLRSFGCLSISFTSDWRPRATALVRPRFLPSIVPSSVWIAWRWRPLYERYRTSARRAVRLEIISWGAAVGLVAVTLLLLPTFGHRLWQTDPLGLAPPRLMEFEPLDPTVMSAAGLRFASTSGSLGLQDWRRIQFTGGADGELPPTVQVFTAPGCAVEVVSWSLSRVSDLRELEGPLRDTATVAQGQRSPVRTWPEQFSGWPQDGLGGWSIVESDALADYERSAVGPVNVEPRVVLERRPESKRLLLAVVLTARRGEAACPSGGELSGLIAQRWREQLASS